MHFIHFLTLTYYVTFFDIKGHEPNINTKATMNFRKILRFVDIN